MPLRYITPYDEEDEEKLFPSQVAAEEQKRKLQYVKPFKAEPKPVVEPTRRVEEPEKKKPTFYEKTKEFVSKAGKKVTEFVFGKKTGEILPRPAGISEEFYPLMIGSAHQERRKAWEEYDKTKKELELLRTNLPFARQAGVGREGELERELFALKETANRYGNFITQETSRRGLLQRITDEVRDPAELLNLNRLVKTEIKQKESEVMEKYSGGEELTDEEMIYFNSFRSRTLDSYIKQGFGDMVGEVVVEMPPYIMEMAVMRQFAGPESAYTGVAEAALNTLKVSSPIARAIVTAITGNSVRMAVASQFNIPAIDAKTADYMLPTYEIQEGVEGGDYLKLIKPGFDEDAAISKAYASNMVEYISEGVGDYVDDIGGAFVKKAFISKWLQNKGITSPGAATKILRTMHFNSILAEVLEEEIAEPIQAYIDERGYKDPFFTPEGRERLLVETLGIAIFSGIAKVSDVTQQKIRSHRQAQPSDKIKIQVEEPKIVKQVQEGMVTTAGGYNIRKPSTSMKSNPRLANIEGFQYNAAFQLEGERVADLNIPKNIAQLVDSIDVSKAKNVVDAANTVLNELPADVSSIPSVKNTVNRWMIQQRNTLEGYEKTGRIKEIPKLSTEEKVILEEARSIEKAVDETKVQRMKKELAKDQQVLASAQQQAKDTGVSVRAALESLGVEGERLESMLADIEKPKVPKVITKEVEAREADKGISSIFEKATQYTSVGEFAEEEFKAKPEDQIGEIDAKKITAKEAVTKEEIEALKKLIEAGQVVEPIVVTSEAGQLSAKEGSALLSALQELGKTAPVVYRGGEEIPGLRPIEEVYREATKAPVTPKIEKPAEPVERPPGISVGEAVKVGKPAPPAKVVQGGVGDIKTTLDKMIQQSKNPTEVTWRIGKLPKEQQVSVARFVGENPKYVTEAFEKKVKPEKAKAAKKPTGKAAEAKSLGEKAFKEGKKRVAASDPELRELLKGLKVGEAKPFLEAWLEGWDEANLAEEAPKPKPVSVAKARPAARAIKLSEVKKAKVKLFRVKDRQKVQSEAKEAATGGKTQEERVKNIEKYTKELLNQADDPLYLKKLRAARAELKRNMYEIVGANTGDWKKDYAFFQSLRNNPELSDLMDTLEESIFQIDEILDPAVAPSTIGYATTKAKSISEFEEREAPKKGTREFKLFEETKALIQKYARLIGEGYTPRGALGIYYRHTKNIMVDSINDLSVVAHEITHFLDVTYKISDKLLAIKGFAINGNPIYDPKTLKYRKAITDLYVKYYGGGRKTHKLRKRALEGFATLLQKYAESPQTITDEYPLLVNNFLKEGGEYYHPVMKEIIKDLNKIVEKYQGLSSLEKVGARVTSEEASVDKDDFLNFFEKLRTQLVDTLYPIEVLAKRAKVHFTVKDPSLWLRAYNSVSGIVNNNIATDRGYWSLEGDGIVKKHDFNWKTLIDTVEERRATNDLAYYLVARREHFAYQELDVLKEKMLVLKNQVKGVTVTEAKQTINSATGQSLYDEVKEVVGDYKELKSILAKDGFSRQEVDEAYQENKERFVKEEKMFDTLTKEDLRFLASENVQLIKPRELERLLNKQGYASFKRQFYNELLGDFNEMPAQARVGKTRVSSLLRRKGSSRTIINPLYSGIANHSEAMRKGLKQVVYNKITTIGTSAAFPDIFQDLALKVAVDKETGVFHYPQEKDPNIIMGRVGYKRKPILVDKQVKSIVDEILTYKNIEVFTRLYAGLSRMFTAGTTGFYPQFAATNFLRDQITAQANTTNKYKTLFSPLVQFGKLLANKNSQDYKYYQEYLVMGGERQTFTGWQKLPPDKLFQRIKGERKGLGKAIALMEKGTDVLSGPAKYSELVTRATEYINARKSGKPQIVALEEAGRLTAPFHHLGKWGGPRGQSLIRGLPFFNATLQVLDQTIRTAETTQGRKRMAFVTLVITAGYLAALTALLRADDEQKEQYKDLEAKDLANNLYFPHPSGKKLIRLPMSDVFSSLGAIINMIIADEVLKTRYELSDYMAAATSVIPEQFNLTEPVNAFLSWIPQIFQAGAETAMGVKTWPTIQPLESMALKNLPPGMRTNENTSKFAKWLGERAALSPIKIDYLLTGYFGRSIGFVTGRPSAYDFQSSVIRDYYFSYGRRVSGMYDLREKNDQDYTAYQRGEKDLSKGEVEELYRVKMLTNDFVEVMRDYRKVDIEKDQEKASELRADALTLISQIDLNEKPKKYNTWVRAAKKRRKEKIKELEK